MDLGLSLWSCPGSHSFQERTLRCHTVLNAFECIVGKIGTDCGEDGSFIRKLNFEEGTTVAIEDAPEGLSYDPETGELSWAAPDEQESGSEVPVILLLKDKDGVESYHIEKILIP